MILFESNKDIFGTSCPQVTITLGLEILFINGILSITSVLKSGEWSLKFGRKINTIGGTIEHYRLFSVRLPIVPTVLSIAPHFN